MTEKQHPAPAGVTIYYWPCSLVLLAPTLLLDRPTSPMCATLRIACRAPYQIEIGDVSLETRASLVAPRAGRKRVTALDSEIALFYLPLQGSAFAGLKSVLGGNSIVDLPIANFECFIPTIRKAMHESLPAAEIKALVGEVVEAITGQPDEERLPRDPRITKACRILDEMPLNEVSLPVVARTVYLSVSRLRELFKQQIGLTIGEYARWRGVWRASLYWQRGLTITEAAQHAGFHDLAHIDKAFNEVFGMSPSTIIDRRFVKLVNCE